MNCSRIFRLSGLFSLLLLHMLLAGCSLVPGGKNQPPPSPSVVSLSLPTPVVVYPTASASPIPAISPSPVLSVTPIPPSPEPASPTPCQAFFHSLGFWPDERHLLGVSGMEGQNATKLQALALDTLQAETLADLPDALEVLALAPDGHSLAWALPDHSLRLLSLPGLQILAEYHGHMDRVTAIEFSPQGDRLYTGSLDYSVRTWDMQGNLLTTFEPPAADGLPSEVMGMGLSPDGKNIVVLPGAGALSVWRLAGKRRLGQYPGIISGAYNGARAVFSPDGASLVAGLAAGPGSVSIWDLAGGKLLWQGGNMAFDLSTDGRWLAVTEMDGGGLEEVVLRTADGGEVVRTLPEPFDQVVWRIFFSPGGRLAAVNDSLTRVWQAGDGRLLAEYRSSCP